MDQPQDSEQPEHQPEVSDYDRASQSTADFIHNIGPIKEARRKRRHHRIILLVLVVIVALGAVGYGVYSYLNRSTEPEPAQETERVDRPEDMVSLQTFSSRELGVRLEHPSDWTVDESVADQVSLVSTVTELPDSNGGNSPAKGVVTVRANDGTLPGFEADSATAARDSIKFSYESPSQIQRAETYLSFLSQEGAGTMNAIYISGDFGYEADAVVSKDDMLHVDPTVSIRFYACQDDVCNIEESNTMAIQPEVWEDNRQLQAAFGILKSLHIQ